MLAWPDTLETITIAMNPSHETSAEEESIDRDIARFVSDILAASSGNVSLAAQRLAAERGRARWTEGGPVMRRTLDLVAGEGSSGVRVRLFDAHGGNDAKPALIYVHGGGFVLFSLDTHDRLMREYAARSGAVVIGVDYSLSPEAKFPTALHEVVSVVDWIAAAGPDLGVDPARLAIGGDSAGANLSLAACLMLRDGGERDRISAMLLNYGFFDADFSTRSQQRHGGPGKLLTTEELAGYLENYLGGDEDWKNPLALPALAELHDLPPSFHVIAECDPLADSDLALAVRLQAAGNHVTWRVYPGATHSFLEAVSISPLAERAFAESSSWLCETLSNARNVKTR